MSKVLFGIGLWFFWLPFSFYALVSLIGLAAYFDTYSNRDARAGKYLRFFAVVTLFFLPFMLISLILMSVAYSQLPT